MQMMIPYAENGVSWYVLGWGSGRQNQNKVLSEIYKTRFPIGA